MLNVVRRIAPRVGQISVSEVLHRAFIEGIGERKEGSAVQPAAPRTEVPSVGAMFAMVKKVDTAIDFVDTDADSGDEEADTDGQQPEGFEIDGVIVQPPQPLSRKPEVLKSKTARLLKPSADAKTSLTMLDACLPKEPIKTVSEEAGVFAGMKGLSPWLTRALLGNETNTTPNEVKQTMSLTARLPGLSRRMRSLLHRGMYAQGREGGDVGRWAEPGRPAGFIGAGLAEELCLAVFGRVKALRACKAGKQVRPDLFRFDYSDAWTLHARREMLYTNGVEFFASLVLAQHSNTFYSTEKCAWAFRKD